MTQSFEAIVENGIIRPVTPVALPEGAKLEVTVTRRDRLTPQEILDLAASVYEGLTEAEIDEIERIAIGETWFHPENGA